MSTHYGFPEPGGALGLVGDIGGTNARFAVTDLGSWPLRIISPRTFPCARFESAEAAIDGYLHQLGRQRPRSAVIAVAGAVSGGEMSFTNGAWSLSEQTLISQGFSTARLINDFAAVALGAAAVSAEEWQTIGPELPPAKGKTIAVMGAGTGFGVAALVRDGERSLVMTTEGGHASFAPSDAVEMEILKILQRRFGRVSIERVLSGPGLRNLYSALAEYHGAPAEAPSPEEIARQAECGEDHYSVETLDRFCAIFGSVAGDFALGYGALGGVYLAGGIAPNILNHLAKSQFRKRFEQKGRFRAYMSKIPTGVILQPHAALLGAAEQLRRLSEARSAQSLAAG